MQPKHKKASLFRGLFNLGGLWAAILAPVMIIIVGLLLPFADARTLTYLLRIAQHTIFKVFILLMIILPIWCGLYRISNLLRQANIYLKRADLIFFSVAFFWSAYCGYVIFIMDNM
ncbi:fumarate reductase subunit FrdD [Utexia brackfieldae]|uniref:fumarate reductase subunit FrdD n=1 Tax=Utexia brackfieldae TaxID=3074108 RepID=UPI00370D0680